MDNLCDYIYLVLFVIAGLTSLLGKRKKSEARKQRPVVLSEKSWEERMRDLSRKPIAKDEEPEETGTMVEPEEFEYKMPEKEVIPAVSKVAPKESILQPTQIHIVPTSSKLQSQLLAETEELLTDECWTMATVEDARRAFVYSEIFNRKY